MNTIPSWFYRITLDFNVKAMIKEDIHKLAINMGIGLYQFVMELGDVGIRLFAVLHQSIPFPDIGILLS